MRHPTAATAGADPAGRRQRQVPGTTRGARPRTATHIDLFELHRQAEPALDHRPGRHAQDRRQVPGPQPATASQNGAKLVLEDVQLPGRRAQLWQHATDAQLLKPAVGQVPGCPGRQRRQRHPAGDRALRQLHWPAERATGSARPPPSRPASQASAAAVSGHRRGPGQLRETPPPSTGSSKPDGTLRPEWEMPAGRWNHGPFRTFGWLLLGGPRPTKWRLVPAGPLAHRTGQHPRPALLR